jgi:Fur family ferric uptake transcriptional regulator
VIANITHAVEIFTNFLKKGPYRITPERFEVLEKAFAQNEHFSADELYLIMKNEGSNISRATVYNTLELLVTCGLLSKQNFLGKEARFEKIIGVLDHNHLICVNCGGITEFKSSAVQKIQEAICDGYNFVAVNHSFNIYGYCKDSAKCKPKQPVENN